jgi:hypothetical protein
MASTPLHSFWALGLAAGPLSDMRCTLALIDHAETTRDYVAEVVQDATHSPFAGVARFPRIGKRPLDKLLRARSVLRAVSELSAQLRPEYVIAGNDRRAEFHAAMQAAPQAVGGYIDDGMFSYMPLRSRPQGPLGTAAWGLMRRLVYGQPTEHPALIGASRSVSKAWVMLPQLVHSGLSKKQVNAILPDWFQHPGARALCAEAIGRANVSTDTVRRIQLLLVLPHESFLRRYPELILSIGRVTHQAALEGKCVAFKRHPRSQSTDVSFLPRGSLELPRHLPVELLAPFLTHCRVVGSLTTALISLHRLGSGIEVRFLPRGERRDVTDVYRDAGVMPLD